MKIDGYSKHTHSLTHIHWHALAHPHPHTHTPKIWGKGGGKGDSTGIHSIKLEITTLIENKKMEKTKTNQNKTPPPTTDTTNNQEHKQLKPPTCRTGDTGHFRGRTIVQIECPSGASVEIFAITPATLGTGLSRWSGWGGTDGAGVAIVTDWAGDSHTRGVESRWALCLAGC